MRRYAIAVAAGLGLLAAPAVHADVPVDPQYINAVRTAQGRPAGDVTDQQLMAQGLTMCADVTAKSGVVDPASGLPAFTRSEIRANLVAADAEALSGSVFDAAVTYLCADAWEKVPSAIVMTR